MCSSVFARKLARRPSSAPWRPPLNRSEPRAAGSGFAYRSASLPPRRRSAAARPESTAPSTFSPPKASPAKARGGSSEATRRDFGWGCCDPAVAPPGDGGLDNLGGKVGAQPLLGEREEGGGDLRFAGLEVLAAPLRAGMYGDAGHLRDTLVLVVPDPVQWFALDLHPDGLGNAGRPASSSAMSVRQGK